MALTAAQVTAIYETVLLREPTEAQIAVAIATAPDELTLANNLISSSEAQTFVFPVIQVYQAVFGRVPDAAGLNFWVDAFRDGTSLADITAGFVASDEFVATYGNVTDGSDPNFISALYQNILGRPGDPDGVAFWTSQTGISPAEVVRLFALDAEFTGLAAQPIRDFLIDVSVNGGDYEGSLFGGGGVPQVPGKVVTLTSFIDGPGASTPSVDTDGTNNNDLYLGSFVAANGDFIDGKGGYDTLKLTGSGGATTVLTSVERIEVTSTGFGAIDVAGSTGIEDLVAISGTGGVEFANIGGIADLTIKNQTGGTIDVIYTPATVAGTADKQSIALDNYGLATQAAGDVTINGIETFEINAGGVNRFQNVNGDKLTTVTVEGAGSVRMDASLSNKVTTFDASEATGNIRVAFQAGGDVAVTTGAGDDRVKFDGATGFTTKDTVDLGEGTNTLVLQATNIAASTNEQLKAINAAQNVQVLEFDGGGVTLNHATLTNAGINKFVFDTLGADVINNAGTKLHAFGASNTGGATFTMAGSNTPLNLALEGVSKATGVNHDDADVGLLNTGGALTVNLSSTGTTDAVIDLKSVVAGNPNFNDVGFVVNAANATFNLTGDAHTFIGGFNAAVNLQAGDLTGDLRAVGSADNDVIVGGSGANFITGGNGVDNIDITASAGVGGDIIDLLGITFSGNRDVITGFDAGAGGDMVRLAVGNTTAPTGAGQTIALQEVNSNTGITVFNTAVNDLLEFAFNIAGNALAGATNGSALLAAIGDLSVTMDGNTGYIVAYQAGNAYLYHVADTPGGGTTIQAGEVQLVGTFNGVAVGEFDASNFLLA